MPEKISQKIPRSNEEIFLEMLYVLGTNPTPTFGHERIVAHKEVEEKWWKAIDTARGSFMAIYCPSDEFITAYLDWLYAQAK